jgi:DNA ligase 1
MIMKNKNFQNLPQQISPKVGIPIKPMLSKSIKGIGEVLERFNGVNFTCEYKYDGMRGQIHFNRAGYEIKLYSRNLEKMTLQFPELPE